MANDVLSSNEYVKALRKILKENPDMGVSLKEFNGMILSADTLQKQLDSVLGELSNVKKQLSEIQDKKSPIIEAFEKIIEALESKVAEIQAKLDAVKANIIDGAKKAVTAFKEKGVTALNSALKFLKVKNTLELLNKDFKGAIRRNNNAINSIKNFSSKYHEIGKLIKNIGRTIVGKEQITQRKENGKLSKVMQAPYKAARRANERGAKNLDSLIGKMESLDKFAGKINKGKEQKPSIMKGLEEKKAEIAAKVVNVVTKDKKREVLS